MTHIHPPFLPCIPRFVLECIIFAVHTAGARSAEEPRLSSSPWTFTVSFSSAPKLLARHAAAVMGRASSERAEAEVDVYCPAASIGHGSSSTDEARGVMPSVT
ncbi:hypothetical protein NL676_025351 [Syzygium grande]|nr:hypothetical protein NL676_025351 [Syzygium grande]